MTPGDLHPHLDSDDLTLAALGEELSPANQDHLAGCLFCRDHVDELAEVVWLARSAKEAPADVAPPERVWTAIREGIAQPAPNVNSIAGARVTRQRHWRAWPLLAAAMVGLLVGAGFVAAFNTWQSTPTVLASAPLAPVPGGPGGLQSGTAEVKVVDGIEMLSVTTRDLTDPVGFYEVWLIDFDSGAMLAMGAVPPGVEGILLPIPPGVDLTRYRAVDISEEPFDGDPAHSTVSVLRGDLTI